MSNHVNLPSGWELTTLGEIANVVGGGTPKTNISEYFEGGTIPWITPADLSGYTNKHISHGVRFITEEGLKNSSARMMPTGAILFTSRAPVGYVAIAANPVCTNQGFKSFILKEGILPDYVYWYLKGSKELAESMASGTTFLELSGAKAKQIPIPLAPPEDQKRIVAEIEKQFSRLDEAVASLKRIKTNLKRYKSAVLKAAVEGKLTEQWRNDHHDVEPADQLLKRILVERRSKWETEELAKMKAKGIKPKDDSWKKKYKEPAGPDTTNLPELPVGWVWARAEQISDFITKGTTPSAAKLHDGAGDIRFLKVYNLTFSGRLNYDYKAAFVDQSVHQEELTRSKVFAGDVLINIVGPPLGQVSIVPPEIAEANINQAIARFRPLNGVLYRFLAITLMTKSVMSWAIKRAKTTAGQSNLTLELCRELPMPLPSLAEQTQVVAEIDRRLSVTEELETTIEINLKRAERLRQTILKEAFSGRL